jgi:hypothetical protein
VLLYQGYTLFKTFILTEREVLQRENTGESSEVESDDEL